MGFVKRKPAEGASKSAGELAMLLGECVAAGGGGAGSGGDSDLGSLGVVDGLGLKRSGGVGGGGIEADILWVYNNLQSAVGPGDAPSPGAWALLGDLRKDGKLRSSFWTSIIPKFLKNVGDGGEDEGEIDGTVQLKLIDRIRKEREKAMR